jgi:hypothetical protein
MSANGGPDGKIVPTICLRILDTTIGGYMT